MAPRKRQAVDPIVQTPSAQLAELPAGYASLMDSLKARVRAAQICRERNRTIVEYTLRDTQKPIGIATYQLLDDLPERLRDSLPSPERLAAELEANETEEGPH